MEIYFHIKGNIGDNLLSHESLANTYIVNIIYISTLVVLLSTLSYSCFHFICDFAHESLIKVYTVEYIFIY